MTHKCISPFVLGVRAQSPAAKRSKVKLVRYGRFVTHTFASFFCISRNVHHSFFTFCVRARAPVVAAVRKKTRE